MRSRSVIVISAGFATVLLLLMMLFALRITKVSEDALRMQNLRSEYLKKELVFRMRDAAHIRAVILLQMAGTHDPVKQKHQYDSLNANADKFIKARDQLLTMDLQPAQRLAWNRARPLTVAGRRAQDKAARLIIAGKFQVADKILKDKVIPIQNHVMQELTRMLEFSTQRVNKLLDKEKQVEPRRLRLAIALAAITLLIGIGVTLFVVRIISRIEADLVKAREEAQTANHHKTAFLANISHELRTPLTAILGYSEILYEDARDSGLDEMSDDLQKIVNAGTHLLGLINDILDLAKVEAGKTELFIEDFDIATLLDDIATSITPLLDKNNNELILECPKNLGKMHTDSEKVRQILLNLLSNATKFTSEGRITLTANREKIDNQDWLTFQVTDTGIGINSEQMSRLFQSFSQGDASTTRKYGGTGLGLAISKRFCTLMGGNLTAESEVGVGSTFTVKLPGYINETETDNN